MGRTKSGVGERELALLRWLGERAGASVGEAAEAFGETHRLARSTVQTMLERLHEKGYLRRRRLQGVYRYAVAQRPGELLHGLVRSFVEGPLGGSLFPVVAYLVEQKAVSAEERAALERLVERLAADEEGER
jgi:predicted transcriptional regulator